MTDTETALQMLRDWQDDARPLYEKLAQALASARAQEREACAQLVEHEGMAYPRHVIAAAIRARGKL